MKKMADDNQMDQDDCLFSTQHMDEVALGILEPEDRARVEHHLARCRLCRAELVEIDTALQQLPYSVDQFNPNTAVKNRLLQRMQSEITSPPKPATRVARPRSVPVPKRSRRPGWAVSSMFVGLCIALVAIVGWNMLPVNRDDGGLPQGQIQVLAMESKCDDCHQDTGGHIGADPNEKDGMVIAWNLDPSQKHEVWCVNKDGVRLKVGDLTVATSGSAMQTIYFPEAVGGYDQIYVARNDGTEELTVAPNKIRVDDDPLASPSD